MVTCERSTGTLMCIGSAAALRRHGRVREARLRRGRHGRHAALRPLRARGRCCSGCSCSRAAGRAPACAGSRAGPVHRARPRRVGLRRAGRLLLRRARTGSTPRCSRCSSTRSRRWSPSPPSCSGASAPTRAASRRSALASGGLGARRWPNAKAGALDPSAPALALARRRSTRPTSSRARASRGGCRPTVLSALVCTGATVTLTAGTALVGDLRPRRGNRRRLGLAGQPRGGVDRCCGEPVLRGPQAGRAHERGDPVDGRAGGHGDTGVPRVRRAAGLRSSCSAACS